jgi:hypothetical protein
MVSEGAQLQDLELFSVFLVGLVEGAVGVWNKAGCGLCCMGYDSPPLIDLIRSDTHPSIWGKGEPGGPRKVVYSTGTGCGFSLSRIGLTGLGRR